VVAGLAACGQPAAGTPPGAGGAAGAAGAGRKAVIELEKGGSITLQLFPDVAPQTVKNFQDKAGKGYYNGLIFHRVEDWVVQGGDPTGTGTGGDNSLPTEVSDKPFGVGSLGVARRGDTPQRSNDSQFFIVKTPPPAGMQHWTQLDHQYTNFGQVLSGLETVNAIQIGDKIKRITVDG
jgi:cyclophilin family peptidyl-prolyl cis-trans isomerase